MRHRLWVDDPQCAEPIVAPATDAALVQRTVDMLNRRNVFGVISDDSLGDGDLRGQVLHCACTGGLHAQCKT